MDGLHRLLAWTVLGATLAVGAALAWAQHNPSAAPPAAPAPQGSPAVPQALPDVLPPAAPPAGPPPAPPPPPPTDGPPPPPPFELPPPAPPADGPPAPHHRDGIILSVTPGAASPVPGQGGHADGAIAMEWKGPARTRAGRPADYALTLRNSRADAVQGVVVRLRMPADVTVAAVEPKLPAEGNVLMWELGTMLAKEEKTLLLRLVPKGKGKFACQAWVTFIDSSVLNLDVTEPKLVLKATAQGPVLVGEPAPFTFTIANAGDGPAEQVKIHAVLSDGLEHPRGKTIDFDIGNLEPGESRNVQLICGARTMGEQTCEVHAEAEGDLKADDKALLHVVVPRLELEAAGPKLRYLDRKAVYLFKVVNPGEVPATNVTLNEIIPAGFKFIGASEGGRHDFATCTVSWFLGEIAPGQAKEVQLEVVAVTPGENHHQVTAQAARGLTASREVVTQVEGLSAVQLDVTAAEGTVEVGADTTYEVRLTNTGSKTETDIRVTCVIPEKMQLKNAQGPTPAHEQGKEVVFDPLPTLMPRASAVYRITVKAAAPGDVRFKAQVTSTNLVEPVIEMRSTRIYQD